MSSQPSLLPHATATDEPVVCLGLVFASDDDRRAYFIEELRRHLQDPEFRTVEGFPIGEDEDILDLSDPPYYTACLNPFLREFAALRNPRLPESNSYDVRPYAGNLTASRNNAFVNAHSYATKVPHEIVMRLLLHYTAPGDLILDGFAGTGMTAVAAQQCNNPVALTNAGFHTTPGGGLQDDEGERYQDSGQRRVIVGDLSPAATFIAANLNLPFSEPSFDRQVDEMVRAIEEQVGWMNKTRHANGELGDVIAMLWSDVYICPNCSEEYTFWDAAVNFSSGKIESTCTCPYCAASATKRSLERAWITRYDDSIGQSVRQFKQTPVLVVYEYGGSRFEKTPDSFDFELIKKIETYIIPEWYPTERMPDGDESRRNDPLGVTHVHHFFTKRNLAALACAWHHAQSIRERFMLTSMMYKSSTSHISLWFRDRV